MPVALDWVIVRLVGDGWEIVTLPLATVPPVGSDCAVACGTRPKLHDSATRLTEQAEICLGRDVPKIAKEPTRNVVIEPPLQKSSSVQQKVNAG